MRRAAVVVVAACVVVLLTAAARATAPSEAAPATTGSGSPQGQPWDLVYISDSSGWGVARFYARRIREDRGVTVRVYDEWQAGLPAVTILERLRTPGDPWARLARNAEAIVVYGNPAGLGIKTVDAGGCSCRPTTGCRAPLAFDARSWRPYVATLKAIYKRIFELRAGKPVILRSANWYVPMVSHPPNLPLFFAPMSWEQAGTIDACTREEESHSAAIARAAAAFRVPVADVYTAFNGPDHRQDPFAKGYLQADGIHPSDAGRAIVAQTLAALGYKQVRPPG